MPHIIAHRINQISELKLLNRDYGLEIDLRDKGDQLLLEHDPFVLDNVDNFVEFIKFYEHGTLILNIKSERIEERILEMLREYGIEDYFFLDSSFPMIKRLIDLGERKVALRFSEYEGLETIRNMSGKVDWVWVDCFTKLPINQDNYRLLKDLGYKLCLVSPDLQGRPDDIAAYRAYLSENNIIFDAVCVKQPNINAWGDYL